MSAKLEPNQILFKPNIEIFQMKNNLEFDYSIPTKKLKEIVSNNNKKKKKAKDDLMIDLKKVKYIELNEDYSDYYGQENYEIEDNQSIQTSNEDLSDESHSLVAQNSPSHFLASKQSYYF